jgi:CheY-like chemotaxis protein
MTATTPPPAPRILYVDDDDSLLFLARRLLRRAGFDVVTSRNPDDALSQFRADPQRFDLVVTDVNMPGMSGIEMARELRALRSDLPVVLMSGHVTPQLRAEAQAAGVREIVYKQNSVEQICLTVEGLARQPKAANPVSLTS